VHLVLEVERLRDEELEREDVGRRDLDLGRERVDRDGEVLGLGGEEDAGEPAYNVESQVRAPRAVESAQRDAHDVLRVVVHGRVAEVEALEVAEGRRRDNLGELEGATEPDSLLEVVGDEELLVGDAQVLDVGWSWRCRRLRGRLRRAARGRGRRVGVSRPELFLLCLREGKTGSARAREGRQRDEREPAHPLLLPQGAHTLDGLLVEVLADLVELLFGEAPVAAYGERCVSPRAVIGRKAGEWEGDEPVLGRLVVELDRLLPGGTWTALIELDRHREPCGTERGSRRSQPRDALVSTSTSSPRSLNRPVQPRNLLRDPTSAPSTALEPPHELPASPTSPRILIKPAAMSHPDKSSFERERDRLIAEIADVRSPFVQSSEARLARVAVDRLSGSRSIVWLEAARAQRAAPRQQREHCSSTVLAAALWLDFTGPSG